MRAFVKVKIGSGGSSKDASSAATNLVQISNAKIQILAALCLVR